MREGHCRDCKYQGYSIEENKYICCNIDSEYIGDEIEEDNFCDNHVQKFFKKIKKAQK